jgi:hypothetical protein
MNRYPYVVPAFSGDGKYLLWKNRFEVELAETDLYFSHF